MKKTIKLIAALTIIGTAFTSCTQEEAPTPQIQLEDFDGTYEWVKIPYSTNYPIVYLETMRSTSFEGLETVEIQFTHGYNEHPDFRKFEGQYLIALEKESTNSFKGLFEWRNKVYGNVLLFIDPVGTKKFSIEFTDGGIAQAIRID